MNRQHSLDRYEHKCWLEVKGINIRWQATYTLCKFGKARNIQVQSCPLHTAKDTPVLRSSYSEHYDKYRFHLPAKLRGVTLHTGVWHCTQDYTGTLLYPVLWIFSDYMQIDITRKSEKTCIQGYLFTHTHTSWFGLGTSLKKSTAETEPDKSAAICITESSVRWVKEGRKTICDRKNIK